MTSATRSSSSGKIPLSFDYVLCAQHDSDVALASIQSLDVGGSSVQPIIPELAGSGESGSVFDLDCGGTGGTTTSADTF